MDEKQEFALLERLYSAEIRIEALTMLLIEELCVPRKTAQEAVDLVLRYAIIAQEEKLSNDEVYRRRREAYRKRIENPRRSFLQEEHESLQGSTIAPNEP